MQGARRPAYPFSLDMAVKRLVSQLSSEAQVEWKDSYLWEKTQSEAGARYGLCEASRCLSRFLRIQAHSRPRPGARSRTSRKNPVHTSTIAAPEAIPT